MSDLSDSVRETQRAKNNERGRRWRAKNKERLKEYNHQRYVAGKEKFAGRTRRWRLANPEREKEAGRIWRKENRGRRMLVAARKRAKVEGSPFSIELSDIVIPERCPIPTCGVEFTFEGGSRNSSASLDKVVPLLGYVPGNVGVICSGCNRKKNNSTAEELLAIAEWIYRIREERGPC